MATEPDKVDSGVLGTLIAVLAIGVLATALGITALVRTDTDEIEAERSSTNETFAALRGAQEADLYLPPAYMDQKTGVVRLPIDRAMQMVVRELRKDPASATAAASALEPAAAEGAAAPEGEGDAGAAAPTEGAEKGEAKDKDKGDTSVKKPPKPPTPKKPEAPKPAPQAPAPKPPAPKPPTPVPAQPKPLAPAPAAPTPAP